MQTLNPPHKTPWTKHENVVKARVYHPTLSEWNGDPIRYIESKMYENADRGKDSYFASTHKLSF